MRGVLWLLALTLMCVVAALGQAACSNSSTSARDDLFGARQGGIYLALGDSIAAGTGASDMSSKSYVGLVTEALQLKLGDALVELSPAFGGATTQDLIGLQLPATLDALRDRDVRLITVTIGGNDLNILQTSPDAATCIGDVDDPRCPVAEILVGTEERLNRTVSELRAAGPDTPIVIQVYPNLFSGTGHVFEQAAEQAFGKLNDVIKHVAAEHDILIADPSAAFEGRGGELTHTLDATPDFHPNDAGYRVIADAFLDVLGLERVSP